ncbi:MAG: prolyl oligopeptidase family serine peptidase [Planctomycetota bacterium]|nr:prolyl oligopeptidase family serine peptidase [Planctomycetota bacterium]
MSCLSLLLALAAPVLQDPAEAWRRPPAAIEKAVLAPVPPRVQAGPRGQWLLLLDREPLPPLAEVARPWIGLAGMRVDPATDASFSSTSYRSATLRPLEGGEPQALPLPEGTRLEWASFSPQGDRLAWCARAADHLELWLAPTADLARARRVTDRLSTVMGGVEFTADGGLVFRRVPEARGAAPRPPAVPRGPLVQETRGVQAPARTYQDLLKNPEDEALFEHHARTEVVLWRAGVEQVLVTGLAGGIDLAPGGGAVLVELLRGPWSRTLPVYRFSRDSVVLVRSEAGWSEVARFAQDLQEEIPIGGVQVGPRSLQWDPLEAARLVWCEALDGGDPGREAEARDRWLAQRFPEQAEPVELLRTQHRARGLTFLPEPGQVLAEEYDRDRRWTRTLLHTVSERRGSVASMVLEDRSAKDLYADLGSILTEPGPLGAEVAVVRDGFLWRSGRGATPQGDRPFLARQSLESGEPATLWRCPEDAYHSLTALLEPEASAPRFLAWHESTSEVPNLFLHEGDSARPLTEREDPQPMLRAVSKELVTYERADGVPLSATLYLPPDHEPGDRHPLLVWGYPLEYSDANTAGQVSGSPHRFTRMGGSSHLFLTLHGYAVLDGATMPVVGDPETMNDTFIEQLVLSAQAAVDFAVERGVADRERCAVAGHSYGAFMTANLLAHSDLFRAGIARSGAYNRSLTPFGFQSERRTLWEATETYVKVSPFFHAHRIDEPLLLVHGTDDNNSGTFPIQSQRLYHALVGNGGTARFVQLPGESHGYRSEEAVLHTLAEMADWLDAHVRDAAPRER